MGHAHDHRDALAGMTKKERKEYQREVNRIERADMQRRRRRNRRIGFSVLSIVMVGVLAGVGIWAYSTVTSWYAGPANMSSDGVRFVGAGDYSTITVTTTAGLAAWASPTPQADTFATDSEINGQLYLDFSDPDTKTFWDTSGDVLQSMVTYDYLALEVHPFAEDTSSAYAVRAAAAVGCVAAFNSANAWAVIDALASAAGESSDVDGIATVVGNAGVTDETTLTCVKNGDYTRWVKAASQRAAGGALYGDRVAVTSSPTFDVAGERYTGAIDDLDAMETFVTDTYSNLSEQLSSSASASESASAEATESASSSASASSE